MHLVFFSFSCGVRLGRVLLPVVYVDLISKLVESGLGCSVDIVNIGCLFYADDIVLSGSLCKLLQNICRNELCASDLKFNLTVMSSD